MTPPPENSVVVTSFRSKVRRRVRFTREPVPVGQASLRVRPAHAARMLALAHHFEAAIEAGTLNGPSDAGRRIGITSERVTQVLTLRYLAPDIQEDVLFLEVTGGSEPFTENDLRKVARVLSWALQRRLYARLWPDFDPR